MVQAEAKTDRLASIDLDKLRSHWEGHRQLTRRVIDVFPEDKLFTYSLGGMRPFGEMANELIGIAGPMARGLATDQWEAYADAKATNKAELLAAWDATTREIDKYWSQIPPARFNQMMTAFGQWKGTGWDQIFYAIDNEVHHRGQGYVYLRSLGIEPPPFWERDEWG